MTDTVGETSKMPLGVGRVVGDTFSILFRKLPVIILLGFIPALVQLLIVGVLPAQSASPVTAGNEVAFSGATFLIAFLLSFLVTLATSSIVTAMIVQLSYDAKLNRSSSIGRYFASAIRNLPVIVLLSIVSTILFALGWMLLVVPGLWLMGVFSVFVPAIVIEGAGFRALRRSAELTKNYRWPIIGAMILVFLCLILLWLVLGVVVSLAFAAIVGGSAFIGILLQAVGNGLTYGIFSIAVALIYARLKEIKEGVSVSDLVDVFK